MGPSTAQMMMLNTATAKVAGLPAALAVYFAKFGNHKFLGATACFSLAIGLAPRCCLTLNTTDLPCLKKGSAEAGRPRSCKGTPHGNYNLLSLPGQDSI